MLGGRLANTDARPLGSMRKMVPDSIPHVQRAVGAKRQAARHAQV